MKNWKRVVAQAPVRVDLAGGTLDLWPLGLLEPGATTVAVAIDLFVQAELVRGGRPGAGKNATIEALDLRLSRSVLLDRPTVRRDRLELLERLVRALAPEGDLRLATRSPVRAGSGLGTSSALGIAIARALSAGVRPALSRERAVALVRDIEAQILGIPTGTQDHLAAWIGGAIAVTHLPGSATVRRIDPKLLGALSERLLVIDSVQGRSSGPSNWDMYSRRIGQEAGAVRALRQVASAGAAAAGALLAGNWSRLGRAMRQDLDARREWSELVVTPEFSRIFEAVQKGGGQGWKVCGAGGGGFGIVLCPPNLKGRIAAAAREAGAEISPARPTARGVRLLHQPRGVSRSRD